MIGARVVVFAVMSSTGLVREREDSPRVLSDVKRSNSPPSGSRGGVRKLIDRELGTGTTRGVEDRPNEGGILDHPDTSR